MDKNRFWRSGRRDGGSLLTHVECSYNRLVEVFGEPNGGGDGYKVKNEWLIMDAVTGAILSIYDWHEDAKSHSVYKWHVGGRNMDAAKALAVYIVKIGV